MPRIRSAAAAEALALALHDLAQPLSAAALFIETASLLLARNQMEACAEPIHYAGTRLELAKRLVGAMKIANGAEPSPWRASFEPAEVLNSVWTGLRLDAAPALLGDRNFFEAAVVGLSLAFIPDASRSTVVRLPERGGVHIRLKGEAKHPPLIRFWLGILRKAGVKVRQQRWGKHVTVVLVITT